MRAVSIAQVIVVVISITAVTGCSTPATLRNSAPDIEVSSTKSSKSVAMCIADRWENGAGPLGTTVPINMRETTTGYTVMWLNSVGGAGMLADVYTAKNGSQTRYYRGGVIGAGTFEVALSECQ